MAKRKTDTVFELLTGARVLITGGTGFVGSAMLDTLADNPSAECEVYVSTRRAGRVGTLDSRVQFISGTAATCKPPSNLTHIVHLEQDGDGQTMNRVLALCNGGATMLYASSGIAQFGNVHTAYAEKKRDFEGACWRRFQEKGARIIIARLWAFIGPRLPLGYAASDFIHDGISSHPIIVRGTGHAVRAWMHTSDLGEWLWALALFGKPGEIYNVGSEEKLTVNELAIKVGAYCHVPVEIKALPGVPSTWYVPDTKKARDEFGLFVRVGIDEAIARTVEWYKNRKAGG